MSRCFAALAALICLAALAVPARAEGKVGFLHPQRVLNESKIGKAAQEDLARFAQEKDRVLRTRTQEIQAEQKKLQETAATDPDAPRKQEALRLKYQQQDRLIQESNEEIRMEEQRLARYVMQKADAVMKQIAAQQGFTIILTDPEAIGYIDASADITDQVIRALDQASVAPPPKKK
jgi:outer membrane protein